MPMIRYVQPTPAHGMSAGFARLMPNRGDAGEAPLGPEHSVRLVRYKVRCWTPG